MEPRRLLSGQVFAGQGPLINSYTSAITTADLNGDSRPDVAAAASLGYGGVSVNYSNGDGTFQYPNYVQTGKAPSAIVAGDFDGDGKMDLAVACSGSNALSILRNTGSPGTSYAFTVTTVPLAFSPSVMTAGDFNRDGRPDLAVAGPGSTVVLQNTGPVAGESGFATLNLSGSVESPTAIVAADLNGDDALDLALAGSAVSDPLSMFLNTGSATLEFYPGVPGPRTGYGLAAADFNQDGRTDLAVSDGSTNISVLTTFGAIGGPIGYTTTVVTLPTGAARALVTGDFDGDGKIDLAAANYLSSGGVTVLRNNSSLGNAVFTATEGYAVGPYPTGIVAGDFNSDGRPDLASPANTKNTSSYLSVLLNSSAGAGIIRFPALTTIGSVGSYDEAVVTADFDGDGKPDVVVANDTSPGTVRVLRNTSVAVGQAEFATPVSVGVNAYPRKMITADFNGDGRPDLATLTAGTNGTVSVTLNTSTPGNISFAAAVNFNGGASGQDLAAGDFNGDGRLDIAVANGTGGGGSVTILRNSGGSGAFAFMYAARFGINAVPSAIISVDLDGDGKTDLATANSSGYCVTILRNTGTFSFDFNATNVTTASIDYSITTADLDLNGKPDLIVVGTGSYSSVTTLRNFSTPGSINLETGGGAGAGTYAKSVVAADFTGDGRPDLIFPDEVSNSLTLFENFGTSTYIGILPTMVATGEAPNGVGAADFDGDGQIDLAVSSRYTGSSSNGSISVLLNQQPVNPYVRLSDGVLAVSGDVTIAEASEHLVVETPAGHADFAALAVSGVVINGTAQIVSDLGVSGKPVSVTINPGAVAHFGAKEHLASLIVNGTADVMAGQSLLLRTSALAIGPNGRLDLNDNDLIYDYSYPLPQAVVVGRWIRSARNNGTWNGAGLTSSAAAFSVGNTTTLGYMEATDYKAIYGAAAIFDGETIPDSAVLVKYTLYGDADFNRAVDFNDFLKLQNGFGGTNSSFAQGDFNYDGATDFNDFLMLQNNFNQSIAATPVPTTPTGSTTPVVTPPTPPADKKTATLSGVAFVDHNKNGKFDAGDGVGRGAVAYLDLDNDGVKDANEPSAVADGSGKFSFKNLAAGKYRVRQVLAKGTVDSTPAQYVTLARGQAVKNVMLGSRAK